VGRDGGRGRKGLEGRCARAHCFDHLPLLRPCLSHFLHPSDPLKLPQLVWSTPLGPTLPPSLAGLMPLVFIDSAVVLDRCWPSDKEIVDSSSGGSGGSSSSGGGGGGWAGRWGGRQSLGARGRGLGDVAVGDTLCCMDAIDVATGELLWSHCFDHSYACLTGRTRAWFEQCIFIALVSRPQSSPRSSPPYRF
jgi:hypothetical protein